MSEEGFGVCLLRYIVKPQGLIAASANVARARVFLVLGYLERLFEEHSAEFRADVRLFALCVGPCAQAVRIKGVTANCT